MLRPSKKLALALEAMTDIAFHGGSEPVQSQDIARRLIVPRRYLEQVMQQLVRAGILRGVRGPLGGYKLARESNQISVGDIVRVVRGIEEIPDTPRQDSVNNDLRWLLRYPSLTRAFNALNDEEDEEYFENIDENELEFALACAGIKADTANEKVKLKVKQRGFDIDLGSDRDSFNPGSAAELGKKVLGPFWAKNENELMKRLDRVTIRDLCDQAKERGLVGEFLRYYLYAT